MGDIIPKDRFIEKLIKADAKRELNRLYEVTAGFADPDPPTDEQVRMMATGLIEL